MAGFKQQTPTVDRGLLWACFFNWGSHVKSSAARRVQLSSPRQRRSLGPGARLQTEGSGEWLRTSLDPSICTLEGLTHTPGGLLRSRFGGAARKRAPYFTWRMETKKLWEAHAAGTSAHRLWTSLTTNQPLESTGSEECGAG